MQTRRNYLYILVLFIFLIISLNNHYINNDISSLYLGVSFDGSIIQYLINYILFSCYSLFFYSLTEEYITNYGYFIIVREKSKKKFFFRLTKRLINYIITIELVKIILYLVIALFIYKSCTIDIIKFLKYVIITLLSYFVLLFIQMVIEIYFTSQISIIITMICYLLSLINGALLINYFQYINSKIGAFINLLLIPNFLMNSRVKIIIDNLNISYYFLILFLILLIIILYLIFSTKFTKKDIN
jgi:hypothetical protein